ncbi:E3 ubiquitin-protein ligase ATL31-like [Pyrus ussuriensis x Pyrus communis]|uniref:E3 ubiquitin-protein ligase ATL31-like n=1 Tax=Pyrus ussuriensis x Pyrus communis TaxID=2448454 RepID=A0A5N5H0C1_9ROSA|nr:E3 ubiquitin-protein ligase ATL31-like [Pyrus ussuriensis x Pyrus communis]
MRRVLERVRRLRNVTFASQIRPHPSRLHLTPDSHSTGHSQIRPRLDTEWFTLRLLEKVRRQLASRGNNKNLCPLDHLWEPDDFHESIHHHNPARQRSFNPCRRSRT